MHSCFIDYLGIFCYSITNWTKSQMQNNKAWICTLLIIIDIKHWFHIKHFYVFWEMPCQIFFYTFLTEWLAFHLYLYKFFYFIYSLLIWHTVCNSFSKFTHPLFLFRHTSSREAYKDSLVLLISTGPLCVLNTIYYSILHAV